MIWIVFNFKLLILLKLIQNNIFHPEVRDCLVKEKFSFVLYYIVLHDLIELFSLYVLLLQNESAMRTDCA